MNDEIREKLKQLPDKPGCYIMRDRRGRIIYVGKAVSLTRRVHSYFRPSSMRRGNPKLRSLVHSVQSLEWIVLRSEEEALLTEDKLIKQHQPKYNILLKDDKRYLGIRGSRGEPYPRLTPCRLFRCDGADYFGPFPTAGGLVRPLVEYLERKYGLKRCRPTLPDADTCRHCLDEMIRTCSAPCLGRISQEEYRRRYDEACACLRGERPDAVEEARARMAEAAEAGNFEAAAKFRDAWLGLKECAKKVALGPMPTPEYAKMENARGLGELQEALGLKSPPHVIECFDISNTSGLLAVASMVCSVEGVPDRRRYRRFRMRGFNGPDDPRMIAQAVTRRYTRLMREGLPLPDLVILDGGITQLRAARAALLAIGLQDLPTVGLAEKFEELVTDNGKPPVLLPRDSEGLMVVTRLRDEAHRFAITYHRLLRNKTIRESVLDEIQGIGEAKKTLLLRRFGSVRRIARADIGELVSVPGITDELAAEIKRRLSEGF